MAQMMQLNPTSLAKRAICLDALIQDKSTLLQPSLSEVLAYKNQHITDGLMLALDIEEKTAEQLFEDGLMWLWYCNHHDSEGFRNIDDPILILDEVWHMFLLYTPYYMQFCLIYFGEYLHHMPTLKEVDGKLLYQNQEDYLKKKKRQLETIYELLGKDVFIRWYHEYPKRYNRESILAMRKK
jgi:hypothetical protein